MGSLQPELESGPGFLFCAFLGSSGFGTVRCWRWGLSPRVPTLGFGTHRSLWYPEYSLKDPSVYTLASK